MNPTILDEASGKPGRPMLTARQRLLRRRIRSWGWPAIRMGIFLILCSEAIMWIGALDFPELWDWPILASAHGANSHRVVTISMASLGGLLLGAGIVCRLVNGKK
jgi:hypothetical protein